MRGLHLTADLRGCAASRPVMTSPAVLRTTCLAAVAAAGLTPVGELFHRFDPAAAAGGAAAPSGITGDNSAKAEALLATLLDAFHPASVERHAVERGSAPSATAATAQ